MNGIFSQGEGGRGGGGEAGGTVKRGVGGDFARLEWPRFLRNLSTHTHTHTLENYFLIIQH